MISTLILMIQMMLTMILMEAKKLNTLFFACMTRYDLFWCLIFRNLLYLTNHLTGQSHKEQMEVCLEGWNYVDQWT